MNAGAEWPARPPDPPSVASPPSPPTTTGPVAGVLAIFVGVQLAQILGALDGTIVATALPTISSDLGGFSRITWVITAYALATAASMPIYGKLGDLYGRKRMLVQAIGVFLVASLQVRDHWLADRAALVAQADSRWPHILG